MYCLLCCFYFLVMEALGRMLDKAVYEGYMSGFSVGNLGGRSLAMSHLLFTDDTNFLWCWSRLDFDSPYDPYLVWGNFQSKDKSGQIKIGSYWSGVKYWLIVECPWLQARYSFNEIFAYLGLPLGAKFKDKTIWNPILEKMEMRLAGWKHLYLSKGGRVTFIKSTLSNLPTYFLSVFPIPAAMANRIEKLQRNFLWSDNGDKPKFHLD